MRFVLSALDVTGVSAYPRERLEEIYADSVGKEVSLAEVYKIADDIQRVYREDGYFLTRAILPPQETAQGKLPDGPFAGVLRRR